MLIDMIQQFTARDIWRDYTATMLYSIGKMFATSGWEFPTYHEMVDFEAHISKKKETQKSAKDTLEDLKGKLGKGGKRK